MASANPAQPEAANPRFDPRNARDVYRVASEAMELIHRHSALPDPVCYAVFFAYAAKSNGPLTQAVARKLARNSTLSAFEINEIFTAYLEQDSHTAKRQNIGLEFEYSLAAVSDLILASVRNNDAFRDTLDAIGQRLPTAISIADLDALVGSLVVENRKMSQAMQELDRGLAESHAQIERLNRELEELQNLSLRDPLTEVSNRRAFDVFLAKSIEQAERSGKQFCLAVTDIDHFKRVNDTLGHQAGDVVLREFSALLRRHTKGQDMVARCGGEEFALILTQTFVAAAHNLLVRVAHDVRDTMFLSEEDHEKIGQITASFGVCAFKAGMKAEDLLELADAQLYRAKRAGRNCVKSDFIP